MSNKIKTGWLTITRKCNNFCEWCYTQRKLSCENMDFIDAKNTVDKMKELGIKRIVLIGGEPTLYPDLVELIKYITLKDIKVSMATNGRKLSDKEYAKKIVESGINSINISLKGTTEDEYLQHTKSFGLMEAVNGYKNLVDLGFENVSLSYVIVNNDKNIFEKFVKLLKNNKLNNVVFQFVKPVLELKSTDELLDIESMGKFVEYIYSRMQKFDMNYCFEISFPLCAIERPILEKLISEKRISTCCHISKGTGLIMDTDFKILPCNHFAEFPYSEEKIGLKSSEEISEFLNSDVCQNLRRIAGTYPSKDCINCELWQMCGGGCFTRWFYQDPEKVIPKMKGGVVNEIK